MKLLIRRATERGHANHGWLDTYHTFSFADYYDEKWMGWKSLRVINEDRIAGGGEFGMHGHKDMEIITYVMKGALRHTDSMGNSEVVRAGEFQRMTAGAGVMHSEANASPTEECHLYQIWILPSHRNLTPSYESFVIPSAVEGSVDSDVTPSNHPTASNHPGGGRGPAIDEGRILIVSPDGRSGSLVIHQDAEIWLYRLEAGDSIVIPAKAGTQQACWLQVVSGDVEIGDEKLSASDAVALIEPSEIKAVSKTELLAFIL